MTESKRQKSDTDVEDTTCDLPPDILVMILVHLSAREVARSRLVCKVWLEIISYPTSALSQRGRAQHLWGCAFSQFPTQIANLKPYGHLLAHQPLPRTLFISRLLHATNFRQSLYSRTTKQENFRDRAQILVQQGILTPEQAQRYDLMTVETLARDDALVAMAERLITPDQIDILRHRLGRCHPVMEERILQRMIRFLFEKALLKFTPDQWLAVPNPSYLYYMIETCHGQNALSHGLITLNQLAAFPDLHYVSNLFYDPHGYDGLKTGLFTPEQVAALPTPYHVTWIVRAGFSALQEGHITMEQVAASQTFTDINGDVGLVNNSLVDMADTYEPLCPFDK